MALQLPYVPVVEKPCCSLRTGALCIGWLAMICSLIKFSLIIIIIINMQHPFLEDHEQKHVKGTIVVYTSFLAGLRVGVKWLHSNSTYFTVSLSMVGVLCFIETIFICMLLDGIHNEKPSSMQPYLLCSIYALVSVLLGNLLIGVYVAINGFFLGLTIIFLAFLASLIFQYMWSVLYSHYRELEEKKNGNIKYDLFSNYNKLTL